MKTIIFIKIDEDGDLHESLVKAPSFVKKTSDASSVYIWSLHLVRVALGNMCTLNLKLSDTISREGVDLSSLRIARTYARNMH